MSDDGPREWRFYLSDMIEFAERTLKYTNGIGRTGFAPNEMVYDAALRNLELIGEAATRIPAEIRSIYPDIPWRMVIATRNRLIHGYLGIDDDTLWSIIQDEVPKILPLLNALWKETL